MFSRSFFLASALYSIAALAQNAFINPVGGYTPTAGQSTTLKWAPTTDGTVTLVLRSGASNDLNEGTVIASNINNNGSYLWAVPSGITRGSDYTVEIIDDADPSQTNYTPYFVLESDVTVAYSTSQVSLGAPSTSLPATISMTASSSAASSTMTTMTTTTSSSDGSDTSSTGGSSAAAPSTSSKSGSSSSSAAAAATTTSSSSTEDSDATTSESVSASAAVQTDVNAAGSIRVSGFALVGLGALVAGFVL